MRKRPYKGFWLLSAPEDNVKSRKTTEKQPRYHSAMLSLAPYTESGYQVCPMARLNKCHTDCLYWTGRGSLHSVLQARIERTQLFFEQRERFFSLLEEDLHTLQAQARRLDKIPCVRLNGTSDIIWEKIFHPVKKRTIIDLFLDLQFYDYTKIYARLGKTPPNYHLTFSHSEYYGKSTHLALQALGHRHNIAKIYPIKRNHPLPSTDWGYPVLDGDEHDLRFLDPQPVIIGLRHKYPTTPNNKEK